MAHSPFLDGHQSLLSRNKKKNKSLFLPGAACYPADQENHHLRLSFSYMNEQPLTQGVTTICHLLQSAVYLKNKQGSSPHF